MEKEKINLASLQAELALRAEVFMQDIAHLFKGFGVNRPKSVEIFIWEPDSCLNSTFIFLGEKISQDLPVIFSHQSTENRVVLGAHRQGQSFKSYVVGLPKNEALSLALILMAEIFNCSGQEIMSSLQDTVQLPPLFFCECHDLHRAINR